MKKLFTSILLLFVGLATFAQTPSSFNYQAVLRDASGGILSNQEIEIGIALLQGSATGTEVFAETHAVTTNEFGLVNLQIGSVNTAGMETIYWSDGPYFIEISVDGTVMGTSQLLSVPFAMHAKTVENDNVEDADADPANELQDISLSGTELSISQGSTIDLLAVQDGTGSDNQRLYLDNNVLRISGANSVTLPYITGEQDGDATNELQTLSISNDTLSLSKGNYVKLPIASTLADADEDTKIQVEEIADEDMLRVDLAGNETLTMSDSTGTILRLPTNDDNSNLKVANSDGKVVFGVDGSGMMYGDGSGLSNVRPLMKSAGGNSLTQITANYAWYQNVKSVTLETPCSGKCFVMASGYARWESKGWDLYLASILRNADPNESWDAENEFFHNLNLATDYNCADSSDQYASFAQHRCFNVGAGTQTFTLWANKYSSSSKVRLDDVNITVLFFPTSGTGGGTLKSARLDAENEQQEANVPFTNIPRRPDGSELRKRIDAMINNDRKQGKIPDDELIKLQKTVNELKTENESLRKEKK